MLRGLLNGAEESYVITAEENGVYRYLAPIGAHISLERAPIQAPTYGTRELAEQFKERFQTYFRKRGGFKKLRLFVETRAEADARFNARLSR